MAQYVKNETDIPSDDLNKIKARLIKQIADMEADEVSIIAKSEASFRFYLTEAFKSIAQLFGYIVAQVVGTFRDIGRGIITGWNEGWKEGLGD
ncbi:hypothetical protein [Argonema antarcticum]|uniref:hypothetical protein n=1 Tax=Argonema antarcticum TaxID=2942763 RepID=UPI002013B377|nr:hypothetical protein [Argonema antarcticum]MCL1471154.1 hypothetical protein [Argonema antarcticum A004/B2]